MNDNIYFIGAAVNLALKTPWKGEAGNKIGWIVIMHSDVFPEDISWLSNMGKSMQNLYDQNVKMISPLTNNPMVDNENFVGLRGDQKEDYILEDGYLPMYCSLMHRELFKRVGLFKEYPYAGVEVEEFAQRMKLNGYKQAVCGNSWVNHIGRATLSNFDKNEIYKSASDTLPFGALRINRTAFVIGGKDIFWRFR